MNRKTIGLAMCGSFCTFARVLDAFSALDREQYDLVPIQSQAAYATDTRFGAAADFRAGLKRSVAAPSSIPSKKRSPSAQKSSSTCSSSPPAPAIRSPSSPPASPTAPVTLAAKAHLRNERPIVLAVSTNDGLAGNAASLGALLNRRGYYFVPFGQDSAIKKPRSLVADFPQLPAALSAALQGQQLQPMLCGARV